MESERKKGSVFSLIMKYLVPLTVTVGLCWVMFTKIDFREMVGIIREQCNFWWIALMLFFGICAQVFRAYRWRLQLRAIGVDPPIFIVILSIFGTYAVNLVFPRLGEIWRCTYIAHRQKSPFTSVFGSMLADRLADTLTVGLLTLLALCLAYPQMMGYLRRPENVHVYDSVMGILQSPWLWVALAGLAAAGWWLIARSKRLQDIVRSIWQGFAVVAKMRGKGAFLLYTVGIWGSYFMALFSSFFAFPFTVSVFAEYGIVSVLLTFVLTSIAMGVPANGGIGPYQWACMLALACYGVNHTHGLAFGNLDLGMTTLMTIALGIFTFVCIMLDKRKNRLKGSY